MNWNWALAGAITTLVMGPWNFGLAGERPVIRAQGGMMHPESYPVYHDGEYCEDCEHGHCFWHGSPLGKCHYCWTYVTTLGGKQSGRYGRSGRNGRNGRNGNGGLSQEDNRYLYRYRAPQNLRYPPANQPAGVVVYPYYTVKGPDDFFLNE